MGPFAFLLQNLPVTMAGDLKELMSKRVENLTADKYSDFRREELFFNLDDTGIRHAHCPAHLSVLFLQTRATQSDIGDE